MVKSICLSSAMLLALTVSATAGSVEPPAPDLAFAVPAAPAGADWSGFYAGASVGFASGNIANGNANDDLAHNTLFGAFAGYNIQHGKIVFGGELDYTFTPVDFATFTATLEDNIDLKARVGYSLGNALIYGVVGYSLVNLHDDVDTVPLSGINFGAGVDYMIGSRYFVGAEYLARSYSGDFTPPFPGSAFSNQIVSTVRLRAGMSF